MTAFLTKYRYVLIFVVLGGVAGYLYWYFIGCNSGTCPITSKWHNSAIYGSVFGYLIGDFINPDKRKKKEPESDAK